MPVFSKDQLTSDPEGLDMLATLLHSTPQARATAMRRGQEKLRAAHRQCRTSSPGPARKGRDAAPAA